MALRISDPTQVAEAKGKANEAQMRAQAALDKANQIRARVESSNKELRELISHIKAFLSRECWCARELAAPAWHCVLLHLCCTCTLLCYMALALHLGCSTLPPHSPEPCCIACALPLDHPNHPLSCPTLPPRTSPLPFATLWSACPLCPRVPQGTN